MIKLGQKIEILRLYFVEGKHKKQIARELKVSKNTVKTYINEFLESKKELIASGVSKYELIENMIDKPKYNSCNRSSRVMTDEIKEYIDGFIKDNDIKRNTGKVKMCMTAQDMYEALVEKGFSLSYSSVVNTVRDEYIKILQDIANKCYEREKFIFEQTNIWKQSNNITVGDIVYLYVAAPISAILYKCEVLEVDIPYYQYFQF